ncbi:YbaB/EbfC family nucleoid-associated protein [Fodinicola feengrottensis]|uniref:YbaB/EbfC family nucleoid-associated protein n=1 Tax=Fodinicola feengrottensis TaxID=435914 RepID=UPI0013D12F0B|nr:YbaB/EbfC family nucleoid-associated protein [Fodinicola feengrottensis]
MLRNWRRPPSRRTGLVAATVNSSGDVVELELDDRVYRTSDSAALAAAITQTIRAAASIAPSI